MRAPDYNAPALPPQLSRQEAGIHARRLAAARFSDWIRQGDGLSGTERAGLEAGWRALWSGPDGRYTAEPPVLTVADAENLPPSVRDLWRGWVQEAHVVQNPHINDALGAIYDVWTGAALTEDLSEIPR